MNWKDFDDRYIGLFLTALTVFGDCLLERVEKDKEEGKLSCIDKDSPSPPRLSEEAKTFAHLSPEQVLMLWSQVNDLGKGATDEIMARMKLKSAEIVGNS